MKKYPAPALYLTTKTAIAGQVRKFRDFGVEAVAREIDDRPIVHVTTLEALSSGAWNDVRKIEWGMIGIDEADKLTAGASKRNRNLLKLTPRHRLMMSGTPLRNGLVDTYMPVMFLSQTPPWKNWTAFRNQELLFDNPLVPNMMTGLRSEERLAGLMRPLMHTMINPLMSKELETKEIMVKMSAEHRKCYEDLMETSVLEAKNGVLLMSNAAVCNLRGRQILQMPEALGVDISSSKEQALLENMKKCTGRSLVFTSFSTVARILEKRHGWACVDGTMSQNQRQAVFDSEPEVIVGTSAMERGIDLPEISNVHNLDQGFTSSVLRQRAGRITRYGKTGKSLSFVYMCPNTVDYTSEKKIILRKLKEARKVFDSKRISNIN